MSLVVREATRKLSNSLKNYLKFAQEINDLALEGLMKNDSEIGLRVLESLKKAEGIYNAFVEEAMYVLTQNPLAIELRRVVAFQFEAKLIFQMIRNSAKISKLSIQIKGKPRKSSVDNINRIDLHYDKLLKHLTSNLDAKLKEIPLLVKKFRKEESFRDILREIRKSYEKEFVGEKDKEVIREKILVFTVCEALADSVECVWSILEYLLFIKSGKSESLF